MCTDSDLKRRALVKELGRVRLKGLNRVPELDIPNLREAAEIVFGSFEGYGVQIEPLLRRAVERLGGGAFGDAAALVFGLVQGTRTSSSRVRRERAASELGISYETFRKSREGPLLLSIASQIVSMCVEQGAARSRPSVERVDAAPESGMAREWLRRFESYHRIWTPAMALSRELTTYQLKLIEDGCDCGCNNEPGVGQVDPFRESDAAQHALSALGQFALFLWEVRQFDIAMGGLWILPDRNAEQALADAADRIRMHAPFRGVEESFLRGLVAASPHHELHEFVDAVQASHRGSALLARWKSWLDCCSCSPEVMGATEPVLPDRSCAVHQLIQACDEYDEHVDAGWLEVADWYRDSAVSPGALHVGRPRRASDRVAENRESTSV